MRREKRLIKDKESSGSIEKGYKVNEGKKDKEESEKERKKKR